jgi:hypothetical protein
MKDVDGALAALVITGSLAVAHELIRRDRRYGSLSRHSIPLVAFSYEPDADPAIEAAIRSMGAKIFENPPVPSGYSFHVGLDGTTPFGQTYLRNHFKPVNMHYAYQMDLIPTDLILHDGPVFRDSFGDSTREVLGGPKNFRAVLEKIGPKQVAVTALFPEGVDPTLENAELAKVGLLSAAHQSDAYDGNRAYGWLLCDIKNPKRLHMR